MANKLNNPVDDETVTGKSIIIAPHDAVERDKERADIVLSGEGDSARINEAILSLGAEGGNIVFLPGVVNVQERIILYNNITVCSESRKTTFLRCFNAAAYDESAEFFSNGRDNVHIRNIAIAGNSSEYTAETNVGIYSSRITNSSFKDIKIADTAIGLYLYEAMHCVIDSNEIVEFTKVGMWLHINNSQNMVCNNSCKNSGRPVLQNYTAGINLNDISNKNNIIQNNKCMNNYYDIVVSGEGNIILGNLCSDATEGIHLYNCSKTSVTGNNLIDCNYGISISESSFITVNANNANGGYGFYLGQNADKNTVTGNSTTTEIYIAGCDNVVGLNVANKVTILGDSNLIAHNILENGVADTGENAVVGNKIF